MKESNAAEMGLGGKGRVLAIQGGLYMMKRLEAMGIREGVYITKVSAQLMKGPVVLKTVVV